jgi:phosphatidylglycerol lysyltransferase
MAGDPRRRASAMNRSLRSIAQAIQRHLTAIGGVAVVAILCLALVLLHRMLQGIRFSDVRSAIAAIGTRDVIAAIGFAAGSYIALTFYDVLALRVAGRPLPYRTAAAASFLSYALTHNLGMAAVTGTSVRLRVYGQAGLGIGDVTRVQANVGLSFVFGLSLVSSVSLLWRGEALSLAGHMIGPTALHLIGGGLLAALIGLIALSGFVRRIDLFGWHLNLPSPAQAILQTLVSALDLSLAAAALYVLLPQSAAVSYPAFLAAYGVAVAVSVLSHAPGGLGVFEAMMLAGLSHADRAGLAGALFVFRGVYYLLPLSIAAIFAAGREGWRARHPILRALSDAQSVSHAVAPALLSALTFAGGLILLVSGALPAVRERMTLLADLVPLPFVEASHIASSLVGTLLLVLAAGLYRRLEGAFLMARTLLLAGVVFSLLKGLDYEEAAVLLGIVLLLQWTRAAFYRHSALTGDVLTLPWLIAIATAIGTSAALALFAHAHATFSMDMWWHFELNGAAARSLRAELAVGILALTLLVRHLMAPRRVLPDVPPPPELFVTALACAEKTEAMLAFTGDKRFLCAPEGDAFLSYQIQGHSWIAMGDPVGNRDRWGDLMWDFRTRADAEQGRVLFYEIGLAAVPIAIDMGLTLIKYGEEAMVDLASFSLDGPGAKSLRYALRRGEAAGARFEILPAPLAADVIAELKPVSDHWLRHKGDGEKAFSLGRFDSDYLARFDCAVIRMGGRIVAFANIWATPNRAELSIDLLRHPEGLDFSATDFLLSHLMLWGRERGYRTFSLGMAPLTGLDTRRLAPLWARAGNLLYKHGEALYGFEGLRRYKSKFCPTWLPRYIAAAGTVSLARALIDLNSLISSGASRFGQQDMVLLPDLHFSADDQTRHFDRDHGGHKQSSGDDPPPPRSRAGSDLG